MEKNGDHATIPMHKELAKGTEHGLLRKVENGGM
jgi:hypothetical protein